MLGPFTTASRLTPIRQMLLVVLSRAACASMSTTTPTTTTTTRDRGDRYGPMEWAQLITFCLLVRYPHIKSALSVRLKVSLNSVTLSYVRLNVAENNVAF